MNIFYANSSPDNWPACKENEIFGVKSGTSLPDIEPSDLILLRVGGKGYGVRAIWQFDSAEQVGPSTFVPWSDAEYGWILHCTPLVKEFTKPFSEAFATNRKLSTKIDGLFATHLMGSIGMLSPDHGISYLRGILNELGSELQDEMDLDGTKVTVHQFLSDVVNSLSGGGQTETAYASDHSGSGRSLGEAGEPRGVGRTGGDLLIVDNSDENWKVLRYLKDWAEISRAFDIATGYFDIGALRALDGDWQKLDKIRILMGYEVARRTAQALLEGVEQRKDFLEQSIEDEKEVNDFLQGVPAIVEGIRQEKIEVRVYTKEKFHAKAYITHAKLDVVGSAALVGSSNFTLPGLEQNVELNIQLRQDVAKLQAWFETHWDEAEDVTQDIFDVITRHTRDYSPFEVYARSMEAFFRGRRMQAEEWEKTESRMYPVLDQYQREGYHNLLAIAQNYRGALLCDSVGLGKTFIGLMIIERLLFDRKKVALFVPKSANEDVWLARIRQYIPKIEGRLTDLVIYNHTDLLRGGDYPMLMKEIQEDVDAVVIDEAHHFRNVSSQRQRKLYQIVEGKELYLLTATPINNSLYDLLHLIELFSRDRPDYFKDAPLGIHSLRGHFRKMEKALEAMTALGDAQPLETSMQEAEKVLGEDELFRALVVQRSRAYVRRSVEKQGNGKILFPDRLPPKVGEYSLKKTYGGLLQSLMKAFDKKDPLVTLPIYKPELYRIIKDGEQDPFEVGRQAQVVGLIRTLLLKRFESSYKAFEASCEDLLLKLLQFVKIHNTKTAGAWERDHKALIDRISAHLVERGLRDVEEEELEEDVVPEEFKKKIEKLDEHQYQVAAMVIDALADIDQLADFLMQVEDFEPSRDDKLQSLLRILREDSILSKHKVLVFSEYQDTARYIAREIGKAGIGPLAEIDGQRGDVSKMVHAFSPYYNGTSSADLEESGIEEIRVLVSTDVLAEGLNLQDGTCVVNYDLHWNPVRLMQRIGRVDRRLDPELEAKMVEDHPDQKEIRGTVHLWNFLPPDELNAILSLYGTVTKKALRISKVFGIEGKQFINPDDDFEALRVFNEAYEGTTSDLEEMYLTLQQLEKDHPRLMEQASRLPLRLFSGKVHQDGGASAVFFCYRLPVLNPERTAVDEEAGFTKWYLYDVGSGEISDSAPEIFNLIESDPTTPRKLRLGQDDLVEIRRKMEKHINNTYMKTNQMPADAKITLLAWMELSQHG